MSYDFSMSVNVGTERDPKWMDVGNFAANYTYNVSPMFRLAFDGGKGINVLHMETGAKCAEFLDKAIERMAADPDEYGKLNPENGWGSYDGALTLLRTLRGWCEEAPGALMRIT